MRFGIIGTNFVSDFFMKGAQEVEQCEVCAVCDIQLAQAKRFAQTYQIEHVFTDYQDLLREDLIDAIYIAVPNRLHFEIASYFLEHHIPTFCEKPLASNRDEVAALIAKARKYHTYLQEGLIPLYHPNYRILQENLYRVGKIHQVNLNFSKYSSRYDAYLRQENPTTFQRELSNGATMDLGVYLTAFCIGLFGKPERIVSMASLLDTGTDVAGSSIFRYGEQIVNLTYSKASDTKNICEICGEKGILQIDQPSQPQKITFYSRLDQKEEILSIEPKENFYYEISEMITCVEQKKIESNSLSFATMQIIHNCLTEMRKQSGIHFESDGEKHYV